MKLLQAANEIIVANMLGMSSLIMFGSLLSNVNAENSSIGFVRFIRVYDFGQNTCEKNDQAFELLNETLVTCSSGCAFDADCESFFYFPTSLRCDGCKHTYNTDGQLQNVDEQTVYYTFKSQTGYRYIGCFTPPCEVGGACKFTSSNTLTEVTVKSCIQYCESLVDTVINTVSIEVDYCYCNLRYNTELPSNCDTPCKDNHDEMCGGDKVVSVYSKE